MTDWLTWLYVIVLLIPAITILLATRRTTRALREHWWVANLVELSFLFIIPVFYGAVFMVAVVSGLLFEPFEQGFIVGGAAALLLGEGWLLATFFE